MRRNALNALITSKCIGFLCSGEAMLLWGKYALRRRRKLSKKERIFPILGKMGEILQKIEEISGDFAVKKKRFGRR